MYATAGSGDIYRFTLQGTRMLIGQLPGGGPGPIAVDLFGFVYVTGNDRQIYRITPGGVMTLFAAGAQSLALTVDTLGNIYSANVITGAIDRYDQLGVRTTFADAGSSGHFLSFGPQVPEPTTTALLFAGVAVAAVYNHCLQRRRQARH